MNPRVQIHNIQQQIKNDLNKLENSNKIIVKSDKSSNICKMSFNKYKQMSHKEVIKHYQKAPLDLENELNKEAEILAIKNGVSGNFDHPIGSYDSAEISDCLVTCCYINFMI